MRRVTVFILGILAMLLGCATQIPAPEFSGDRAFEYLQKQVGFGPRVPGSEAAVACRSWFYERFDALGLKVDSQVFSFADPYSDDTLQLVNVIASFRGDPSDEKGIILLAHYDSRPRAERDPLPARREQPIAGANDGASGVAVLLELAGMLAASPAVANVDFVLVDGEDWGKPGDDEFYLIGSRHFANQGIRGKYHFGLVIDMIGDADQNIYREQFTDRFHKQLNDMIWNVASELGVATFEDSAKYMIKDDHISIAAGGVPAAVLIDFDYPYWHTTLDTPEQCSPQSLANVGRVVAHIIYNRSLWFLK